MFWALHSGMLSHYASGSCSATQETRECHSRLMWKHRAKVVGHPPGSGPFPHPPSHSTSFSCCGNERAGDGRREATFLVLLSSLFFPRVLHKFIKVGKFLMYGSRRGPEDGPWPIPQLLKI